MGIAGLLVVRPLPLFLLSLRSQQFVFFGGLGAGRPQAASHGLFGQTPHIGCLINVMSLRFQALTHVCPMQGYAARFEWFLMLKFGQPESIPGGGFVKGNVPGPESAQSYNPRLSLSEPVNVPFTGLTTVLPCSLIVLLDSSTWGLKR